MPRTNVALVELSDFTNVTPLVSGYLEAYACVDPEIRKNVLFKKYVRNVLTPRAEMLRDLLEMRADIYAFSSYVWNAKLVTSLCNHLQKYTEATVILGGPQMDGQAAKYLNPEHEKSYVCNGEGELVFRDLLSASLSGADFGEVKGLSFHRDGELVTTGRAPALANIDEIPSPYLTGLFTGTYSSAIWETNRGCPYTCTFCYWGQKMEHHKLRRFDQQRLEEELEWMAKNNILQLWFADANVGILKRDVQLAETVARLKRTYGVPMMISAAAAKNKPERCAEIVNIWSGAGIICSQGIGIQSSNPKVLDAIKRKNIKTEKLMGIRESLREKGASTYMELIWPLPGDTFQGFKRSVSELCSHGVETVAIYPALLLHGTPMMDQVEEYQIQTIGSDDGINDFRQVISTRDVTEDQCQDGFWLSFSVDLLYNFSVFRRSGQYLHSEQVMDWSEIFETFADFCRDRQHPVIDHWRDVLEERTQSEYYNVGLLGHLALYQHRAEFVQLMIEFVRLQPWWTDERLQVCFEMDLVSFPYIYRNSDFVPDLNGIYDFKFLTVTPQPNRTARVVLRGPHLQFARALALGEEATSVSDEYIIRYQHQQQYYIKKHSSKHNGEKVHYMMFHSSSFNSQWGSGESGAFGTALAGQGSSDERAVAIP